MANRLSAHNLRLAQATVPPACWREHMLRSWLYAFDMARRERFKGNRKAAADWLESAAYTRRRLASAMASGAPLPPVYGRP